MKDNTFFAQDQQLPDSTSTPTAITSFESLCVELKDKIIFHLPLPELFRVRQLSSEIKYIAERPGYWLKKLNQFFPDWQQSGHEEETKLIAERSAHAKFLALFQQHFGTLKRSQQDFFQAVLDDNVTEAEQLLAEQPELAVIQSSFGDTAIHYAARDGRIKMLEALLRNGVTVKQKNRHKQTALHSAAMSGNLAAIDYLIARGAIIDKRDSDDNTALHYAIKHGHGEAVIKLIGKGANPALDCGGFNALHTAARYGQLTLVKYFIANGFGINALTTNSRDTALHLAVSYNHQDVVNHLLNQGASVNALNIDRRTPLFLAIRKGFNGSIAALEAKGAIAAQDYLGQTPEQLGQAWTFAIPIAQH